MQAWQKHNWDLDELTESYDQAASSEFALACLKWIIYIWFWNILIFFASWIYGVWLI